MEKKIIEALDEGYALYLFFGQKNEDWLYYVGMLNLVERLGFHWKRDTEGKHIVYK